MGTAKTISFDGNAARAAITLVAAIVLGGCDVYAVAPPCPFAGEGDHAPSAGCFSLEDGKVLLVQDLKGRLSPPGGKSLPGETAQCTAYRETWEETGLALQPTELLDVFDTGFHLYRCERLSASGDIDPPIRFEVRGAFYLPPEEFDNWEWRFPGQQAILRDLVNRLKPPAR